MESSVSETKNIAIHFVDGTWLNITIPKDKFDYLYNELSSSMETEFGFTNLDSSVNLINFMNVKYMEFK